MSQHHYMETNTSVSSLEFEQFLNFLPLTSVCRLAGVGLRVAPPPRQPAGLQAEGAALIIEPPPLLQGAEQLIQRLREVRG